MQKVTALQVLNSRAFIAAVLPDAVKLVADKNGRSIAETAAAYRDGQESCKRAVDELMLSAAEKTAEMMNKRPTV